MVLDYKYRAIKGVVGYSLQSYILWHMSRVVEGCKN